MNQWQIMLRDLMAELQRVLESGEVLSDETQGAIAETMGNLVTRIQEAQREEPPEQPEQPPQHGPAPIEPPPPPDAQLLWFLSGQQEQAFVSYLRTYPTPSTQALLNDPQLLASTIENLSRLFPAGERITLDGIPHAELNSSNVWGANYDQRSGRMRVRFHGGSEYEYDDIPPAIFRAFIHGNANAKTDGHNQYGRWWKNKNPSLGAALNQYVKAGNFHYRRIR